MTLEIQQWTSQQKTQLKICWQKELLLLSLYDSRILLHWGGGETKNNILLTSYRVIITYNKQYYIH